MTELPRSRALVRLDGPGHIMPVEPVTPPGSAVWKVVHFPVILVGVAVGLLALAAFATNVIGMGFRAVGHVPGARFLVPLIGAAAVLAIYWIFVRLVERRRDIAELWAPGSAGDFALAFGGGLLLSGAIFATIYLLGGLHIVGFNPPQTMVQPLVSAICAGIVQEVILRGLFFRLIERALGSWLALLVTAAAFGGSALIGGSGHVLPALAIVLEAGLMFTALYMLTRRLWAAIGLHAAWNFALAVLYGVAQSGAGPKAFVVSLTTGPDWLTGGLAGADASVPALVINAVLVVVLLAAAIRRGHIVRPAWRRGRTS